MNSSTMAPTAALVESLLKPKPTLKMTQPVMPITAKKHNEMPPCFLAAGHIYIYFIYGMYHCLNVVTEKEGVGAAILIRELHPTVGIDIIQKHRATIKKQRDWLNGPSKLMMGLGIPAELNGSDALSSNCPIALSPKDTPKAIQRLPRIGISSAKDRLWRFRYNVNS